MTDTAVQQLAEIREQWGDLLTAIERPPVQQWPPVNNREWEKPAREPDTATVGRLPLILREHPAPVNLAAVDAALDIEHALFALADRLAAVVQRPVATIDAATHNDPFAVIPDPIDADDTSRWHYPSPTSPGSRRNGLHWCAVWLGDRLAQQDDTDLHDAVSPVLHDHAADIIGQAHRAMARALGRDPRTITATHRCPWCHGELTTRATSDDADDMTVTCGTGPTCTAPAEYDDRARRTWHGRDQIAALTIAILHAQSRAAA